MLRSDHIPSPSQVTEGIVLASWQREGTLKINRASKEKLNCGKVIFELGNRNTMRHFTVETQAGLSSF